MRMLTSGSASTQPVARITTAAIATPKEPRRSAKTCRNAASTLRLWRRARGRARHRRSPPSRRARSRASSRRARRRGRGAASTASTKIQIASATSMDAVRERGEDLRALEAEGALRRRRLRREPGRDERDRERDVVREHVHRVREEREAAGEHAADDLDDRVRRGEGERERERAAALHPSVVVSVAPADVLPGRRVAAGASPRAAARRS